ncbi:AraC family transcriptional regulator [Brevundimonas sp.]|uniref:helix-turn-helix domain-containing protein n=1 Tax=Brevundimonas sp. TaxID=1871086 RepID=UPI00260E8C37|nr:AraC family transcriptional regulator [Brevundimonas sp.]
MTDAGMSALARMVFDELAKETPPSRLAWDTYAAALALRLFNLQKPPAHRMTDGGGLARWRLKRAMDYLMAHLSEDVALAEVAAIADLSPHHFCRAFKQSTGLPPHAWLTRQRLEHALQLMSAHPKMGLVEIALCVGYQSQTSFGQAFKRAMGVTPSRWRRDQGLGPPL